MSDYIVRVTAANAAIRAFAVTGRELVETARKAHDTSPVVTAALGRLMMGGVMMVDSGYEPLDFEKGLKERVEEALEKLAEAEGAEDDEGGSAQ